MAGHGHELVLLLQLPFRLLVHAGSVLAKSLRFRANSLLYEIARLFNAQPFYFISTLVPARADALLAMFPQGYCQSCCDGLTIRFAIGTVHIF
jgi:hypothetical protein